MARELFEIVSAADIRELGKAETPRALDVQIGGEHYKACAIQPIQYIFANGLGFAEGNVVKYVTRWQQKGQLEDLRKARHYLDLLIEDQGFT